MLIELLLSRTKLGQWMDRSSPTQDARKTLSLSKALTVFWEWFALLFAAYLFPVPWNGCFWSFYLVCVCVCAFAVYVESVYRPLYKATARSLCLCLHFDVHFDAVLLTLQFIFHVYIYVTINSSIFCVLKMQVIFSLMLFFKSNLLFIYKIWSFYLFYFILATLRGLRDLSSPTRDWTRAVAVKPGILTTRPPGNSQNLALLNTTRFYLVNIPNFPFIYW